MSRIFYSIVIKKYPLVLIIWIFLPLMSICQDTTKTVDDYFNAGADKYINNKSTEALRLVQKGLAIDSSDEKLKKLAELILKKDKNQQQQNNQNQNQNKDQNKDKNKDQDNQDKKDDNKDQKQDDKNNQLTKSDAERMLDALNNKDKNLQDELEKEKVKAGNTQVEKDW
jgi:Ca-activated chloride channel homolog